MYTPQQPRNHSSGLKELPPSPLSEVRPTLTRLLPQGVTSETLEVRADNDFTPLSLLLEL